MKGVLLFHTHAHRLQARGMRNFVRFKMNYGPYSHVDPREHAEFSENSSKEEVDRRWKQRHGPPVGRPFFSGRTSLNNEGWNTTSLVTGRGPALMAMAANQQLDCSLDWELYGSLGRKRSAETYLFGGQSR